MRFLESRLKIATVQALKIKDAKKGEAIHEEETACPIGLDFTLTLSTIGSVLLFE